MLRDGRMLPRLSRAKIKNNIVHPRDSNNRGIIMEKAFCNGDCHEKGILA